MKIEMKVEPKGHESLDYVAKRYFQELDAYQAPFLREKMELEKFPMQHYDEAFTELKKYVALSKLYDKPLDMPSPAIDAVWHQFILFTREYHEFSNRFHGSYFHHAPNLPSRNGSSEPRKNLIRLYEKTYGPIPAIWELCKCHNENKGEKT